MVVVDAHIRVHHPCPYCDISVEFPRSLLLLWCDNRRDIFLVTAPDELELRRVVAALRDSFRAKLLLADRNDALVMIPEFEWKDPPSVTGLARRSNVWALHPVVYFEGKETYRFVAPTKAALNGLISKVRRLGDVEVLSVTDRARLAEIRDLPIASVHFFEGLTDRQARSMLAAYDGGLLDVPARARWNDIARQEGVSRATFGEHLRKGQLRLLANSYSALKARLAQRQEPIVLPATLPPRGAQRAPLAGTRPPGATS